MKLLYLFAVALCCLHCLAKYTPTRTRTRTHALSLNVLPQDEGEDHHDEHHDHDEHDEHHDHDEHDEHHDHDHHDHWEFAAVFKAHAHDHGHGHEHEDHDEHGHEDHDEHGHEDHDEHEDHVHVLAHTVKSAASHSEEEEEESLIWSASKVDGQYAEDKMRVVVLTVPSLDKEDLEHSQEIAEELFDMVNCTEVEAGSAIAASNSSCYQMVFNQRSHISMFELQPEESSEFFAVFTEHEPDEFEAEAHYFKTSSGEDIEPELVLTEEISSGSSSRWRLALAGSCIVLSTTLIGIILIGPGIKYIADGKMIKYFGSFGAGVLLASAVFLIWSEALHLIESAYSDESQGIWRWGTMILAGYVINILVDSFVLYVDPTKTSVDLPQAKSVEVSVMASKPSTAIVSQEDEESAMVGSEQKNDKGDRSTKTASAEQSFFSKIKSTLLNLNRNSSNYNWSLISSISVGDFFHNFADGVFIGAAFKTCDATFAWTLVASAVAHELSQELSDFLLLTSVGGLSVVSALSINFLVGTSTVIGAMIISFADVSNEAVGLILAFGGGTYLYLATTVAMPLALQTDGESHAHSIKSSTYSDEVAKPLQGTIIRERMICLMCFAIGAVAIGLVLLDHKHCGGESDASGGGGGHGHAH